MTNEVPAGPATESDLPGVSGHCPFSRALDDRRMVFLRLSESIPIHLSIHTDFEMSCSQRKLSLRNTFPLYPSLTGFAVLTFYCAFPGKVVSAVSITQTRHNQHPTTEDPPGTTATSLLMINPSRQGRLRPDFRPFINGFIGIPAPTAHTLRPLFSPVHGTCIHTLKLLRLAALESTG